MDDEKRAKAEELLLAGKSVNSAAKAAGINWGQANTIRLSLIAEGKLENPASEDDEQPADDGETTLWDLSIQVPEDRADDILLALPLQEKMNAIAYVLQQRMDELLTPAEEEGA